MEALTSETMMKQVVIAAFATKTIELLKRSKRFDFLGQHTVALNRALSILISIATSAGFTYGMTGSWEHGAVITFGVPPLQQAIEAFGEFFWHGAFQFVSQESIYQGLVRPPKADALTATGTLTTPGSSKPIGEVLLTGVTVQAGSTTQQEMEEPKIEKITL